MKIVQILTLHSNQSLRAPFPMKSYCEQWEQMRVLLLFTLRKNQKFLYQLFDRWAVTRHFQRAARHWRRWPRIDRMPTVTMATLHCMSTLYFAALCWMFLGSVIIMSINRVFKETILVVCAVHFSNSQINIVVCCLHVALWKISSFFNVLKNDTFWHFNCWMEKAMIYR